MIRAGKLRHKGELQRAVASRDDFGAEILTWKRYGFAWMSLDVESSKESIPTDERTHVRTLVSTMRFNPNIRVTDRIILSNRILEITGISDPDGSRETLRVELGEVAK